MFKVKNKNTRGTCSKLTIKTFHTKYFTPFSSDFTVDFEQVNVSWKASWFFLIKSTSPF